MKHGTILIVLLLALASACFGSDYQYRLYYKSKGDNVGGTKILAASKSQATNSFDNEHSWTGSIPQGVLVGIHKTNGVDGWGGATGFYVDDIRPVLTQGGSTIINDIYVWATPDVSSQNLYLCLYPAPLLGTGLAYKLYLVSVPNGVTYNGPMEWTIPHNDITLPFYSTTDGTTGYKFKVEITAAQ